jgi:hypothetical protein
MAHMSLKEWKRLTDQQEDPAQQIVCQWLTAYGYLFLHVPNGGKRTKAEAAIFKALGVQPGAPDLLLFDPPPKHPHAKGVALELKRASGGRLRDNQKQWLEKLRERGWIVNACHGSNDAIDWLESLGYGSWANA